MPRRKGPEMKVLRLTMPVSAIERFERLAVALETDLYGAIRFCATLQLAQLETTHLKPNLEETPAERESRAMAGLAELLPETAHVLQEPEPDVKPFQGLRPGPRSEIDELDAGGGSLAVVTRPEWIGYMANL